MKYIQAYLSGQKGNIFKQIWIKFYKHIFSFQFYALTEGIKVDRLGDLWHVQFDISFVVKKENVSKELRLRISNVVE